MAGGGDYTSKPRPALIIRDDTFEDLDSVTVCALTTVADDVPPIRILVEPDDRNGLQARSHVMTDKVTTVRRDRMREYVGEVDPGTLAEVGRALIAYLGLAHPRTAEE